MKKLLTVSLIGILLTCMAGVVFARPAKPVIAVWATKLKNQTLTLRWDTYFGDKGDKAELFMDGEKVAEENPLDNDNPDGIQMGFFKVTGIEKENMTLRVVLSNADGSNESAPHKIGTVEEQEYKKTNTNTGKWPANAMVGYIDLASIGAVAAITQKQLAAYSVVVFGFADGEGKVEPEKLNKIQEMIKMEKNGTINLLSIGGEHAHHIEINNDTVDNLYNTVKKAGLDGVDFDVENITDSPGLVKLADLLRDKFGKAYFITAAPQLAGSSDNPGLYVAAAGIEWDFTTGVYDAVFVQAYNSGISFTYPNPLEGGKQVNQSNPYIVAAAYDSLEKKGKVNKNTKLLMGIPANAGAGTVNGNVWNFRKDKAQWDEAVDIISKSLDAIYTSKEGINGKQFGGMMVWSIGNDAMPDGGGYWKPKPEQKAVNAPARFFSEKVAPLVKK